MLIKGLSDKKKADRHLTAKILKFRTPEKFVVITVKFELFSSTIE